MNINKQELIAKLNDIQGLTADEKSALIDLLKTQKRYGLVWEDKPEDVEARLQDELPVLTEVKERAIISNEPDAPNHILIEGDNLEALTALSYTHSGKIDVIYIDPPYNTGNKDFVYNDSFVDKEDSYRHSKWLSFMSKRLRIAKQLLSDRGVIFISIDDNEQAQLKLLCDEVFGEQNFIAKFDWRKKTGANDAKDIAVVTESIVLFSKSRQCCLDNKIWARDLGSINKNRYKYSDEFIATRGKFYYDTLDRGGLQYSDSMNFGILMPDGQLLFPNGRSEFVNDGWIWKWGADKVQWGLKNKFLEIVKSKKNAHTKYTIKYKVYENVDNEGKPRDTKGRAYMNLITEPINQQGNTELTNVFDGDSPFSNPKPSGLIKYLFNTIRTNNITILDFFAGSGTTLHATMQLNAEDGGHRKCILVTNNENNICEEVTYERNKRVINGYTTPKGEEILGLKSNTLRYYKTDFVGRDRTSRNMRQLVYASTDLLCIKEDLYTESNTFGARKLKSSVARYFTVTDKQMLVIYNEEAIPAFVAEIAKMTFNGKLKVYVFAPGNYAYDDDFETVGDKIELCALPAAIYNAYQKVLPKRRHQMLPDMDDSELNVDDGINNESVEE